MYLMYVDESGDTGHLSEGSPTSFFALSGLVIHESAWHPFLDATVAFRRHQRGRCGLKLREEIHAQNFIRKPGELARIAKSIRLRVLRDVLDYQAGMSEFIRVVNVLVKKAGKPTTYDIFDHAWRALIQRFHNTIEARNFPGPHAAEDRGLIIADDTDAKKLRVLMRKLRRFNPVPSLLGGYREIPIDAVVEDASHRNSLHSYLLQMADVNAYFLYQLAAPCKYVRKQGAKNYFRRLAGVRCFVASPRDEDGIVRL